MAFPTSVNGQITDIVSSTGEEAKGDGSIRALDPARQDSSPQGVAAQPAAAPAPEASAAKG